MPLTILWGLLRQSTAKEMMNKTLPSQGSYEALAYQAHIINNIALSYE